MTCEEFDIVRTKILPQEATPYIRGQMFGHSVSCQPCREKMQLALDDLQKMDPVGFETALQDSLKDKTFLQDMKEPEFIKRLAERPVSFEN